MQDFSHTSQKTSDLFYAIFNNIHEGVVITDTNGIITSINPSFTLMSGYVIDDLKGKTPAIFKAKKANPNSNEQVWPKLNESNRWCGKVWDRRKNGEIFLADLLIIKILPKGSSEPCYLGLYYEIAGSSSYATATKHYDPLTALPDRLLFRDHLSFLIAHARRNNSYLALLLIDLDRFKKVNDNLGYNAGDSILIATADRIKKTLRETDAIFRLGNDEFAVILEEIAKTEDAAKVAQKILNIFSEPYNVPVYEKELYITGSVGISLFPQDGPYAEDLIKNAETAMYKAKETTQNSYQHYSPAMNASSFKYLTIEHQLYKAFEHNEFVVYYQPIINLRTNTIDSLEALVRWAHPELGLIFPGDFIPIAEETGLIVSIGELVMLEACKKVQEWQGKGLGKLKVSVNLSIRQFVQHNLITKIESILAQTKCTPGLLELEITESMGMNNAERTIMILYELKGLGINLAIDDFGTGYSSLSYLKRFPLDRLKIDKAFVKDITDDQGSESIIASIITMAHALNMSVVAEGVETVQQMQFVRDKQCDFLQGYLFSKPVSAEAAEKLLIRYQKEPCIASLK